jgi:hypothetical protein
MKECRDFLQQELGDGEIAADTVIQNAHRVGLAKRTLDFYKYKLGVESVKHGEKWYWRLKTSTAAEHEDHNK